MINNPPSPPFRKREGEGYANFFYVDYSLLESSVKISLDPGEIYAKKGLNEIRPLIKRCNILFLTEREINLLTHLDLHAGIKSWKRAPSLQQKLLPRA